MKLTPEDLEKLHTKQLANIIRKIGAGKTLTAREEALLQQSRAGSEAPSPSGFAANWDELAQRLGVSRKSVQNWRARGDLAGRLPRPAADGRHDVAAWARAMITLRLARADEHADPADLDDAPQDHRSVTDWKKEREKRQVWLLDVELGKLDRSLLVAADLEVPLGATFAAIQTKLSQFPGRAARFLVGLRDENAAEEKLRDEMDAVITDLHAAPYLEESVEDTVAALPFSAETERLMGLVTFAGQDRAALLSLIAQATREVLARVGRRALRAASSESQSEPAGEEPVPEAVLAVPPPAAEAASAGEPGIGLARSTDMPESTAPRKRGPRKNVKTAANSSRAKPRAKARPGTRKLHSPEGDRPPG